MTGADQLPDQNDPATKEKCRMSPTLWLEFRVDFEALEELAIGSPGRSATMEAWLQAALALLPPSAEPPAASTLAAALEENGASGPGDLAGLGEADAASVGEPLAALSPAVRRHLVSHASVAVLRQRVSKGGPLPAQQSGEKRTADAAEEQRSKGARTEPAPGSSATVACVEQFRQALAPLRTARRSGVPPPAGELARIIRVLVKLPADVSEARWLILAGSVLPELPARRAAWLEALPRSARQEAPVALEEDGIWRELAQWGRSGAQYASAIQL